VLAQHLVRGGDTAHGGGMVLFDQFQRPLGIELRLQNNGPALQQGWQHAHVQGRNMEHRRDDQHHVRRREIKVHHHVEAIPDNVPVR
jgi:hypothetical protein